MNLIINTITYYNDEPSLLQEHKYGLVIEDKFTGFIEHGGKYQDRYYYIDGHELSRSYGGDDALKEIVDKTIKYLLNEKDSVNYPLLPNEFDYSFNDEGQPVRANDSVELSYSNEMNIEDYKPKHLEQVIRYYNEEPYKKDGINYVRVTGTKTLDEVDKQIVDVLGTIEGGLDYEWISYYVDMDKRFTLDYMKKTLFPDGKVVIPASNGNCEGVSVDIYVIDKNTNETNLAAAIKYFHSHEQAYKIACALDEAFYRGLF